MTPNHLGLSSLTLSSVGVVGLSSGMSSVGGASLSGGQDNGQAENLAQDMSDLMHDFDVVSRIASMIGTLKGKYEVTKLTSKNLRIKVLVSIPVVFFYRISFINHILVI